MKKKTETKQTSRIIFDRPVISQNSKVALMYANKRSKLVYSKAIASVYEWMVLLFALSLSLSVCVHEVPRTTWVCIFFVGGDPKCTTMNNQYSLVLFLTPYRSISWFSSFSPFFHLQWFGKKTCPVLLITSSLWPLPFLLIFHFI